MKLAFRFTILSSVQSSPMTRISVGGWKVNGWNRIKWGFYDCRFRKIKMFTNLFVLLAQKFTRKLKCILLCLFLILRRFNLPSCFIMCLWAFPIVLWHKLHCRLCLRDSHISTAQPSEKVILNCVKAHAHTGASTLTHTHCGQWFPASSVLPWCSGTWGGALLPHKGSSLKDLLGQWWLELNAQFGFGGGGGDQTAVQHQNTFPAEYFIIYLLAKGLAYVSTLLRKI